VLKGIDRYIPWIYTFGLPTASEALIDAFMELQKRIDEQPLTGANRPRHLNAGEPSEFPVPRFGAHDLEPAKNPNLWKPP